MDRNAIDIRRANSWSHFTGRNDDFVAPSDGGGRHLGDGIVSGGNPGVGDGVVGGRFVAKPWMVILQRVGLEEQFLGGAAEHE